MKDRAAIMRIAVNRGVKDLDSIRKEWNKFEEGGDFNKNADLLWNSNIKDIYGKLTNGGIPREAALGIVANIAQESGGNYRARSKSGTYSGLTQNSPEIEAYIRKNYNGYELDNQINYIIDGWNGRLSTNSSIGRQLQNRFNAYKQKAIDLSAIDNAAHWEATYERSGGQQLNKRKAYAEYFNSLLPSQQSRDYMGINDYPVVDQSGKEVEVYFGRKYYSPERDITYNRYHLEDVPTVRTYRAKDSYGNPIQINGKYIHGSSQEEANEAAKSLLRRRALDNPTQTMIENSNRMSERYGSDWREKLGFTLGNDRDVAGYTPFVGDAFDMGQIGYDIYNQDYSQAAIGAGMFFLPNVLEKPIRRIIRGIKNKRNIREASENIRRAVTDFYNSKEYEDRLLNLGYTREEINPIRERLTENANNTTIGSAPIFFGLPKNTLGISAMNSSKYPDGIYVNPNINERDINFVLSHELAHSSTKNADVFGADVSDELERTLMGRSKNTWFNKELNSSQIVKNFTDKEVDVKPWEEVADYLDEEALKKYSYLSDPQEVRARLMSTYLDFTRQKNYKNIDEYMDNIYAKESQANFGKTPETRQVSQLMKLFSKESIKEMLKVFAGTVPAAALGTSLYLKDQNNNAENKNIQ